MARLSSQTLSPYFYSTKAIALQEFGKPFQQILSKMPFVFWQKITKTLFFGVKFLQ